MLFTDQIWQLEDRDVVLKKPQLHDLFILFVYFRFHRCAKGLYAGIWKYYCFLSLVQEILWHRFGVQDSCICFLWFDACMMDIYGAITNGAQLHIIPEEIRLDFIGLQRYFEENGITHSL